MCKTELSCTPPVTGILSGTLGLTTNDSSMPTVNYGLKCQGQLLVVNSTDNGQGNVPGSLSYLLKSPESVGKTIKFAPQVISITLNGVENLPPLPVGTQLEGRCGVAPNSPVIISGGGRVGPGLVLNGQNYLFGLEIKGFGGPVLKNNGTGNIVKCVKITVG